MPIRSATRVKTIARRRIVAVVGGKKQEREESKLGGKTSTGRIEEEIREKTDLNGGYHPPKINKKMVKETESKMNKKILVGRITKKKSEKNREKEKQLNNRDNI